MATSTQREHDRKRKQSKQKPHIRHTPRPIYLYELDVNCGDCGDNTEVNPDTGLCRYCDKRNK